MNNLNQQTLNNILNNTALLGENIEVLKQNNRSIDSKLRELKANQEDILSKLNIILRSLDR